MKAGQVTGSLSLIFHTQFNEEFSGDTPEDIVAALHRNSQRGMGDISFEKWWDYQKDLWNGAYGADIPAHDQPGASEALLDVLIRVGALEGGELQPSTDDRGMNVG